MKIISNKIYEELKSDSKMLKAIQSGNFKDLSIYELNLCRQTINRSNEYHELFNSHLSSHLSKFNDIIREKYLSGSLPTMKNIPQRPTFPENRKIKHVKPGFISWDELREGIEDLINNNK